MPPSSNTNCWLRWSPLEVGLILILIIAIPFLIALIIVYVMSLTSHCRDCYTSCYDYCSLHYQYRPKDDSQSCPDVHLRNLNNFDYPTYPFIAAVMEDVYVDDTKEQRFVCAAAIISYSWVITSSQCVQAYERNYSNVYGVFVRAASNYWDKQGTVHEIKQIRFPGSTDFPTIAAIELKISFPKLPTIRFVQLGKNSFVTNKQHTQMYGWETNDTAPLFLRKRNVHIFKHTVITFKNATCVDLFPSTSGGFCGTGNNQNNICLFNNGFPLLDRDYLLGINILQSCETHVHYFIDTSILVDWLVKVTDVFVQ